MPRPESVAITITDWVLFFLATLAVTARLYVRLFLRKTPSLLAEGLVVMAWCSILVATVLYTIIVNGGATTGFVNDLQTRSSLQELLYVSAFFWITGLYFTKLSMAVFYFYLFPPIMPRLRVALWMVTIYIMLAFITSLIILLAWCVPISINWNPQNPCSALANRETFSLFWALNLTGEASLFVLPFFLLPNLHVTQPQLYTIVGIFAIGLITILAGLARFIVIMISAQNVVTGFILTQTELCCSAITVSLPTLRPLVRQVLGGSWLNSGSLSDTHSSRTPVIASIPAYHIPLDAFGITRWEERDHYEPGHPRSDHEGVELGNNTTFTVEPQYEGASGLTDEGDSLRL